jgi:ribosomal protein S12 methylthiotransferase
VILADAAWLAERGVQEIILIAQDVTSYGRDLGHDYGLIELLEALVVVVPEVPWIRVMYAFPGHALDQLGEAIARHPQILPYVDIPLQHAHPDVLRRMRRPADAEGVRRTIAGLRARVPDIALRTAFIVGFPGETEAEFETLLDFVGDMDFDRVGVFAYSHEVGTPAARCADDVPVEVKEARREQLMAVQQPISLARNRALVGRKLDILVEGQEQGLSVGRSYRDAPEIDGLVLVQAALPVGQIVPVRVSAALEYDLIAQPARGRAAGRGAKRRAQS